MPTKATTKHRPSTPSLKGFSDHAVKGALWGIRLAAALRDEFFPKISLPAEFSVERMLSTNTEKQGKATGEVKAGAKAGGGRLVLHDNDSYDTGGIDRSWLPSDLRADFPKALQVLVHLTGAVHRGERSDVSEKLEGFGLTGPKSPKTGLRGRPQAGSYAIAETELGSELFERIGTVLGRVGKDDYNPLSLPPVRDRSADKNQGMSRNVYTEIACSVDGCKGGCRLTVDQMGVLKATGIWKIVGGNHIIQPPFFLCEHGAETLVVEKVAGPKGRKSDQVPVPKESEGLPTPDAVNAALARLQQPA